MSAPSDSELVDFVTGEARLLDLQRFDEWLGLFAEDSHYWMPLEPDQTDPLPIWFEKLGALSARLHRHSRRWTRPASFRRKTWDFDAMLGSRPLWGDWRQGIELRAVDRSRVGPHPVRLGAVDGLEHHVGLGAAADGMGVEGIGPATLAAIEERLHWQRFGL